MGRAPYDARTTEDITLSGQLIETLIPPSTFQLLQKRVDGTLLGADREDDGLPVLLAEAVIDMGLPVDEGDGVGVETGVTDGIHCPLLKTRLGATPVTSENRKHGLSGRYAPHE